VLPSLPYFEHWCQRFAPEVWYGKERDAEKEREYHRMHSVFLGGWNAHAEDITKTPSKTEGSK
jgi:hypothetical protein